MARRRVVITGLGVVAPNGIGKETFWQNLIAGKSAVDYVHAFDASDYPSKVAAEVRDFVPADFMLARRTKAMARFSQFGVAATRLALDDAMLSSPRAFPSGQRSATGLLLMAVVMLPPRGCKP